MRSCAHLRAHSTNDATVAAPSIFAELHLCSPPNKGQQDAGLSCCRTRGTCAVKCRLANVDHVSCLSRGCIWTACRPTRLRGTGVTGDPLAGLPKLNLHGEQGFMDVDTNGVYRAYVASDTVIEATR